MEPSPTITNKAREGFSLIHDRPRTRTRSQEGRCLPRKPFGSPAFTAIVAAEDAASPRILVDAHGLASESTLKDRGRGRVRGRGRFKERGRVWLTTTNQ